MTTTVRVFTHTGLATASVASSGGGRYSNDSLFMLKQPYLGRQTLTTDAITAVSSSGSIASKGTTLLHIEVQPGQTVHYEINPANRSAVADSNSPTISGKTNFEFGPGWTISILEGV
jgi:hypothetical protein